MYTKDEIQTIFRIVHKNMQLSYDAYEKLCNMIDQHIITRLCDFLRDRPLVEQEVINAFYDIVNLNQQNEINIKSQCMQELNRILNDENKPELPVSRTAAMFTSKGFNVDGLVMVTKLLTCGIEYLMTEIIEISGMLAQDRNKKRITTQHINDAIRNDEELRLVFSST